jgi:hypothetical protein
MLCLLGQLEKPDEKAYAKSLKAIFLSDAFAWI